MIVINHELKKNEVATFLLQRVLYPLLSIIEIAADGLDETYPNFVRSIW